MPLALTDAPPTEVLRRHLTFAAELARDLARIETLMDFAIDTSLASRSELEVLRRIRESIASTATKARTLEHVIGEVAELLPVAEDSTAAETVRHPSTERAQR